MTDRILENCGGVFGAALGAQRPFALPGDTPHYARDRAVDVRHIKLEISIDPQAKRIEGAVHTTFVAINDGVSHVEFDAVELEIRAGRLASGGALRQAQGDSALPFSYDGGKLRIELGSERKAGDELT